VRVQSAVVSSCLGPSQPPVKAERNGVGAGGGEGTASLTTVWGPGGPKGGAYPEGPPAFSPRPLVKEIQPRNHPAQSQPPPKPHEHSHTPRATQAKVGGAPTHPPGGHFIWGGGALGVSSGPTIRSEDSWAWAWGGGEGGWRSGRDGGAPPCLRDTGLASPPPPDPSAPGGPLRQPRRSGIRTYRSPNPSMRPPNPLR